MGKARRSRQKFHLASSKQTTAKETNNDWNQEDVSISQQQLENIKLLDVPGGLFKDMNIDISKLNNNLDSRSLVSKKSIKELDKKLTKKEKLKLRREIWLKKIDVTKKVKEQTVKDKKKDDKMKQTVVGSIQPLIDALPSYPIHVDIEEKKNSVNRKVSKSRMRKTLKQARKDTNHDIKVFKQVLDHPDFKSDPLSTISEHITNFVKDDLNKT